MPMHKQTEYHRLMKLAKDFEQPGFHLKYLMKQDHRFNDFSIGTRELFFDFSRQRVNKEVMDLLYTLADKTHALDRFQAMAKGEKVNTTENRAAFHTGARQESRNSAGMDALGKGFSDGRAQDQTQNLMAEMNGVKEQIYKFSQGIHEGKFRGSTKKVFDTAVVVGIGGSYLGCEFVYQALKTGKCPKLHLLFLSNVDIDNFGDITRQINPETCLWIVISKSYTTRETMANLAQVQEFLQARSLSPKEHLVTITAKGSPGDDSATERLASFHMFDCIGGRYSVSSAVGGLPLSLAFGYGVFEEFLHGCHIMDQHVLTSPAPGNIPLTAALISIWNTCFLGYAAQAIIPYASALSKLAPHVQQLYMESLGKMVSRTGEFLPRPGGCVIFGEPGTNAQHSFFQLAHQGPAFPVEFIAATRPLYRKPSALLDKVSNHQELWANLIAQTLALAIGRDELNDLSAKSLGILLSFYEARTVLEGFVLGLNPFDQFGVELGKTLASDIRQQIQKKNQDDAYDFNQLKDAEKFYLNCLFEEKII